MKKSEDFLNANQKVKLLWLLGDWDALANIKISIEENTAEIPYYKISALYQLGKLDEATQHLNSLSNIETNILKKILLSGVYNCLAKANHIIDQRDKADAYFSASVDSLEMNYISSKMKLIRKAEQLSQIDICHQWMGFSNINSELKSKKLFIDCGGYDGCSIIKFFLSNSGYEAITFEANPELWKYYSNLPTKLIGKAVADYDGEIEFIIDPVDGDGSSIMKEKEIDFHKKIKNEDCPKIKIPCIDLSMFIKEKKEEYDEIVLKLDVEGAEYQILDKMINDKTISLIDKLYAEFHWQKIGLSQERHNNLITELEKFTSIEYWDAHEFSIHEKDKSAIKRRSALINTLGG